MSTPALVELSRPTGLDLPEGLTYEEWAAYGSMLGNLARWTPFAIADWVLYGEWRYGEVYAQALELTGLDYSTLSTYCYVARRIPISRRRENLRFSHHAEVAALPPTEQDEWLSRAEREGWKRQQLREAVSEMRAQRRALEPSNTLTRAEYEQQAWAAMDEKTFQGHVTRLFKGCGWLINHVHDSRRDDAGYLDVLAIRRPRLVVAELKTMKGRLRPEQERWLEEWRHIPGAEVWLWRPCDWETIVRIAQ